VERHEDILATAQALRWEMGPGFHDQLAAAIYEEAGRLAGRAVTRPGAATRFDWDRTVDRMVTSRVWGFPLMFLLFTVVFWLMVIGAVAGAPERKSPWLDQDWPASSTNERGGPAWLSTTTGVLSSVAWTRMYTC